jgi:hypothetical protein
MVRRQDYFQTILGDLEVVVYIHSMLTFLRKIRRSLVDTSNTRKYLLYAIGEIALVMIGILMALQVNNWNEKRKLSTSEVYYLEKLLTNLKEDSTELQVQLEWIEGILNEIDTTFYMLQSESNFRYDDFVGNLSALIKFIRFYQNDAVYQNLIASGKIDLISNKELIDLLFNYYDPASYFKSWDEGANHYSLNVFGPLVLNTAEIKIDGKNFGIELGDLAKEITLPKRSYNSFREDRPLINYLRMKNMTILRQKIFYTQEVMPDISNLIQVIEEEIDIKN